MESVTILTPGLGNQLEVQQLVAPHNGLFHGNPVGEAVFDCPGDHTGVVVDIERSCRGNPSNQNPTFDFGVTFKGNLDIIVHIFLADHLYQVFFQLKAGALLPLTGDLLIPGNIGIIQTDHDTIGVELDDFSVGQS